MRQIVADRGRVCGLAQKAEKGLAPSTREFLKEMCLTDVESHMVNRKPPTPPGLVDLPEAHRLTRKSTALNVRKMIEKGFAKKITIVERNKAETVSVFEAILRQLTNKADKGDRRAPRLIGLYQDYAYRNSGNGQEIVCVFVPSDTDPEDDA